MRVDARVEQYNELTAYTLTLGDPEFRHQYVVDAWALQQADSSTKSITLTFALIGLYFYLERNFTGRQVQRVHMLLAQRRRTWPTFALPDERGTVTVCDVMRAEPGEARHAAIRSWCQSIWDAYGASHAAVEALIRAELD